MSQSFGLHVQPCFLRWLIAHPTLDSLNSLYYSQIIATGITQMFNRHEALQTISDMSKDAFGYRVRLDYSAMTDEELQSTMDHYQVRIQENIEMDARNEAAAQERHESELAKLMSDHGIDKVTALRWDMEAYDVDGDRGFYCYKKGLPYSYEHSPDWG